MSEENPIEKFANMFNEAAEEGSRPDMEQSDKKGLKEIISEKYDTFKQNRNFEVMNHFEKELDQAKTIDEVIDAVQKCYGKLEGKLLGKADTEPQPSAESIVNTIREADKSKMSFNKEGNLVFLDKVRTGHALVNGEEIHLSYNIERKVSEILKLKKAKSDLGMKE